MCVHECVVSKWVCIHVYGLMGVHRCVCNGCGGFMSVQRMGVHTRVVGRWVCIDVCVMSVVGLGVCRGWVHV